MTLAGLSLRDLEYAVAVADERHFGRAAERCGVSQPALSAQVRKLEEHLGVPLFERTSRRVLVSARGEPVIRQARAVLAEARRLLEVARAEAEPLSGRFVLGAIHTLGPYLFPHVLRALRERFPRLELTLREGQTADLLASLRQGTLDAVLVSLPAPAEGTTAHPLFFEPFVLALPADHPLNDRPALDPADLGGPELVLLEEGHCLSDQALAACRAPAGSVRHATGLETLRHMVAAGAGYTLMPALAAGPGTAMGGLIRYRELAGGRTGRTVGLVRRTSDPRADDHLRLCDLLREAVNREIPGLGG